MRAVRLYVADPEQRDWDDYAERLVFALNTSYDRTRRDTPFYLLHGWDARTTLETVVPLPDEVESLPGEMERRRDEANDRQTGPASEFVVGAKVWVFINQLWREFSGRPTEELVDPGAARLDFDEALLPEDSFDPDESRGEFEVEKIIDHRDRRLTRQGRPTREYLVRWVGYDEPSWVPVADLNAAGLLEDYEQELRARGRFEMMATESQ
ncbi:hypothetical protein P43SY_011407 [Pythium insidiosum]|uniref:Chromo domain-containing protein n=1 Tax=Pythium insidiosum TaxID=114742 RepID=A0AAD5L769_PYTIN|nr:hypothetical protein P43SY_011407 [Pythium insidiosum]